MSNGLVAIIQLVIKVYGNVTGICAICSVNSVVEVRIDYTKG
jgi:hypothetical protein